MFFFFLCWCFFFFFKQKTAYEMRISDWSSDVCSSDLPCRTAAAFYLLQDIFEEVIRTGDVAPCGCVYIFLKRALYGGRSFQGYGAMIVAGPYPVPRQRLRHSHKNQIGRASCGER